MRPAAPPKKSFATMTVAELEAAVRYHNHCYFVALRPEISDAEFDRLVERLRRKKPDAGVLDVVGSDLLVDERAQVRHASPMLSLDKCYDAAAAREGADKFSGSCVALPKIDGCAVSLRYDAEGRLHLAATRGNGILGEEITANVRYITDIPQQIDMKLINQPQSGVEGKVATTESGDPRSGWTTKYRRRSRRVREPP